MKPKHTQLRKSTGGKAQRVILPPVIDSDDEFQPKGWSLFDSLTAQSDQSTGPSPEAIQIPSLHQLAVEGRVQDATNDSLEQGTK